MTNVYEIVTGEILAALDAGTVPWQQPWTHRSGHQNAISHKPYRGVNVWLLNMRAMRAGFTDPRWLTIKQANGLGGNVIKGEKSQPVVFWKWITKHAADCPSKKICENLAQAENCQRLPLLRYFRVFNVAQCEGLSLPPIETPAEFDPIADAEQAFNGYIERAGIRLSFGGDRAFYRPSTDYMQLPNRADFHSAEGFYTTAFHESAHSTGHRSRLDRDEINGFTHFGDHLYGTEELCAEFGAAFITGALGIHSVRTNQAAYIASWKRTIQADSKLVVTAAARAQKAADTVLGSADEQAEPAAEVAVPQLETASV